MRRGRRDSMEVTREWLLAPGMASVKLVAEASDRRKVPHMLCAPVFPTGYAQLLRLEHGFSRDG